MPTGPKKEPNDFTSLSSGLGKAAEKFGKKMEEYAQKFGKSIESALKKAADKWKKDSEKKSKFWTFKWFQDMKKKWNKFWDSGVGKALKVFLLIGAFFAGVLIKAFKTFDTYMVASAKKFGTMSRDKGGLVGTIIEANQKLFQLGQSFADISGTVDTLTNELGMADKASVAFAANIASSALKMGVSNDEAAQLVVQFNKIMGISKENARFMAEGFSNLAQSAGVSPSAVMKDIAKNTEFTAKFSKGMGSNILNASIQAKKLGINLSSVEKVMSGLLDFENSITKEMEASVLLGRQLNFGEARRLALMGNMSGAMGAVLKQVGGQAAFDRMNVLERMALADAIGVSVSELAKFASGADAAGAEAEYLASETEAAMKAAQEETAAILSPLTKLTATFKSLWLEIVKGLGPSIERVNGIILGLANSIETYFEFGGDGVKEVDGYVDSFAQKIERFQKTMADPEKGISGAIAEVFDDIGIYLTNWFDNIIGLFTNKTAQMLLIVSGVIIGLLLLLSMASKKAVIGAAAFAAVAGAIALLGLTFSNMKQSGIDGAYLGYLALGLLAVVGVMVLAVALLSALGPVGLIGAGALLMIAGAVWILSEAFANILPHMTSFAEVVGGVVIGVMETFDDIINAIADGFVRVMDKMLEFANVDAGKLFRVGASYWHVAGALGAMSAAQVVNGLANVADSFLGLVGGFFDLGTRGLDALGDFLFGEDDVIKNQNITNQYSVTMAAGAEFSLSDNTITRMKFAFNDALKMYFDNKEFKTQISGEDIDLVLGERYDN